MKRWAASVKTLMVMPKVVMLVLVVMAMVTDVGSLARRPSVSIVIPPSRAEPAAVLVAARKNVNLTRLLMSTFFQ